MYKNRHETKGKHEYMERQKLNKEVGSIRRKLVRVTIILLVV